MLFGFAESSAAEWWSVGINVGLLACVITTSIFAVLAYLASAGQAKTESTLEMVKWLQAQDVREARAYIYEKLQDKPYSQWNEKDDKNAASKVCAAFDFAGALANHKLIRAELLQDWWPTLSRCYAICEPLVQERRAKVNPKFWVYFSELNAAIPEPYRWNDLSEYKRLRRP